MPCNDTTSRAVVCLDNNECLTSFDFSKITCGGTIGSLAGYGEFCKGLKVEEILEIEYETMAEKMTLEEETERFLLYLEWSALRAALAQYRGLETGGRSRLASIDYHPGGVEIHLSVLPPNDMPKQILSCAKRDM